MATILSILQVSVCIRCLLIAFIIARQVYLTSATSIPVRRQVESISSTYTHAISNNSLRGINLGGWFIPEYWMVDFYQGTNYTDLCSFGAQNRLEADLRMKKHLATWIVEDDFAWMAEQGINTLRLPIGYWNLISDPYHLYVPIDTDLASSYIDKAFTWTEKYNMSVILDLHGLPGSQNGNDHSGCGNGVVSWNIPQNRELSLQVVIEAMKLFGKRSNLLAIELMNEPAYSLEEDSHEDLLSYYQQSYRQIRQVNSNVLVAFNVLYSQFYDIWDKELLAEDGYDGVIVDWHLYDCFGDNSNFSTEQHIADAVSEV
jgi:glucan 1,3-beta-glucosidase